MNNLKIKFITRTAILLALTIVFQMMGRALTPFMGTYNNFVVGPLVNASLFIATAVVGVWGAGFIALAAPFGAILTGAAIPLPFAPFIALGNLLLVLVFFLLRKNQFVGIGAAAVVKFGFLFAAINIFVNTMNLPAKKATAMIFTFSWPQLVTALIGGILALAVIPAVKRSIK